jgi:signal transduction histidine kinase
MAERRLGDRLLLVAPTVCALLLILAGFGEMSAARLGVAVGAALALLLRRRWPLLVLIVAFTSFLLYLDLVPLTVAVYAVIAAPRARRWHRVLPVIVLVTIPVRYGWESRSTDDKVSALAANVSVVMLLCAVLPTVLALLIRARRDQAAAIAELIRSREREGLLIAQSVRVEERTLLAREMHDVVADKISLISVRAGALTVAGDNEVRTEAETIRSLSKATLDELREVVSVLRDPDADSVERLSGLPELVAGSGLDARLTVGNGVVESAWSAAAQRAVYRTVQESLTNVRKYAASARAEIELAQNGDHLEVVVRNSPTARSEPDPLLPSGGHGLTGLRERAELLGAEFTAGSTEPGGFQVQLRIPAGAGART